jgi:hypothetical protein
VRKDRRRGVAARLLPKYERMRELRAGAAHGKDAESRAALRAFAAEWPGALRELDALPSDEIERRARSCAGGDDEPWMAWMARYHELMRAALAIRGQRATSEDASDVDEEFARAVRRPRHGRLNVVVFAQLGREFDVAARAIWDALFPRRGKAARGYRD